MSVTLKVWRQDGPDATPAASRTTTLDDINEDMSFLEMLDVVNEQLIDDGREPIAFDSDCREGICGTCGLMINGQAHGPEKGTATCQLHMRKFHDGEHDHHRAVAGGGLPGHPRPHGRPQPARRHHRGRRLHLGQHRLGASTPTSSRSPSRWPTRPWTPPPASAAAPAWPPAPTAPASCSPSAKVAHLNLLPQGQAERWSRTENMVETMEEFFGSCTNHGECQEACPKEIAIDFIAYMNRDYIKAKIKNRKLIGQRADRSARTQVGSARALG